MDEGLPLAVVAAVAELDRPACGYVYLRSSLRAAVARLRAALPVGATLLYAMKANGHPAVVAELAAVTDGLEVASGGELALARSVGAARMAFGGPGKTDAELAAAIAAGAVLHVESVGEARRLAWLAETAGADAVPVAVRVNRATGGPAGSHQMTGVPTPFGVDEAGLPELLAVIAGSPRLTLLGFHLHAVSNSLDAASYAAFATEAVVWSAAAAQQHRFALSYVNVGGGIGVDYQGGPPFDLARLRDGLSGLVLPEGVELVFEPGRYLTADAGWYAAEVLDLKRTHGRWFAVLRGGTHHFRLPAAWGYSHPFQVLPVDRWRYPFERPEIRDVAVDAVGELCTPRDVLTRGQQVPLLRVGDVLVFGNTGGYGWDISHHDFLQHPHPQLVVR